MSHYFALKAFTVLSINQSSRSQIAITADESVFELARTLSHADAYISETVCDVAHSASDIKHGTLQSRCAM